MIRSLLLVLSILCGIQAPTYAALDITLSLGNGLTPSQISALQSAESFWENALSGYQPGVFFPGPTIFASAEIIDGIGNQVGQGAPTNMFQQAGFLITAVGSMSFDIDDLNLIQTQSLLTNIMKHEMAHVLGFGVYWSQNSLYSSGSGQYLGARGLAEYRNEFVGQSSAAFVPVELGGLPGTQDAHWDEVDQGAGPTGRITIDGFDMRDELMTGWINSQQPQFVSRTTLGQFEDIGFVANFSSVPEPSSLGLAGLAAIVVCFKRRRRVES